MKYAQSQISARKPILPEWKGLFVTFDGPNGVGKSSIQDGVSHKLSWLGLDVYKTKEPTASSLGKFVKSAEEVYKGRTLACLVAADRYFHLDQEVLPALFEGKIVLSDRYVESSLVLQQLDEVKSEFIWLLNSQIFVPDLSVILMAKPETIDQRLSQRAKHSRFERDKSRIEELKLYKQTAKLLSRRGFNILLLNNDAVPIEKNIAQVVQKILYLKEKR